MNQKISPKNPRRPTPVDRLFTLYVYTVLWTGVIAYILLLGPFLLLAAYTFDPRRNLARRLARRLFTPLVRHFCRLRNTPWKINPAPFNWPDIGPCIIVANHASAMDSILLMGLPKNIGDGRIWSKGWPFKVPLLGWIMRLSGHLFVEDFNILPDAQSCLSDGTSLLVFPESSRTRTGKLGRFRDGAFLLAVRTGRPIVPVAIHGAHDCFPPGQPWMFRPILRVQPLAVLWPATDPKSHALLKREAHTLIANALGEAIEQSQRSAPQAAA